MRTITGHHPNMVIHDVTPAECIEELQDKFGSYLYRYLLYWKKENPDLFISKFKGKKLYQLSDEEFVQLFEYATEVDKKRINKLK